jgi:hypothetical protein
MNAISLLMSDDEHWVRVNAASALGRFGFYAKSALPLLRQGLQDSNKQMREICRKSIEKIEADESDPVELKNARRSEKKIRRYVGRHRRE